MKVLITGDSHTGQLQLGMELLVRQGEWPQHIDLTINPLGGGHIFATPFFIDAGDYAELCNKDFRKQFQRFPPETIENTDVIYGLSGPLHTARVRRSRAWSEFVPAQFAVDETPVSNALLNQVILDDCQYLLKFIDVILRTGERLFVLEAPRPFRHDRALQSIRPEVFSYIDNYYRDFIKQELKLRNVPIIAVDPECYDDAGFMLECYRNPKEDDMHHGNSKFGELMMKKVLKFLLEQQSPNNPE